MPEHVYKKSAIYRYLQQTEAHGHKKRMLHHHNLVMLSMSHYGGVQLGGGGISPPGKARSQVNRHPPSIKHTKSEQKFSIKPESEDGGQLVQET